MNELGAKYKVIEVDALGKDGFAMRVELDEITGKPTYLYTHIAAFPCLVLSPPI